MNLLIADDDRVLTHLLSAKLRSRGWTVTIASDAMQTLMFAIKTPPDVILLDINMPGGTGVEALRKLRLSTKTSMIPIVVLSGSIDPADEARVRALGAEGFLKKPADVDEIHLALSAVTTIGSAVE